MIYNGYDYMDNDKIKELNRFYKDSEWCRFRGNSFVRDLGTVVSLASYRTPIADYDVLRNYLYIDNKAFSYSRTTCRHISLFISRYVSPRCGVEVSYQDVKKAVDSIELGMVKVIGPLDTGLHVLLV